MAHYPMVNTTCLPNAGRYRSFSNDALLYLKMSSSYTVIGNLFGIKQLKTSFNIDLFDFTLTRTSTDITLGEKRIEKANVCIHWVCNCNRVVTNQ